MPDHIPSIDDALRMANQLVASLELMKAHQRLQSTLPSGRWKKANGRLTDAGVAAMHQMFGQGTPDAEIARRFGVTQTAVWNQRKKWERGR